MRKATTHLTRRAAIARVAAAAAASCLPSRLLHAAEDLRFGQDPFTLGIASGYPAPGSVVLWTRLAPVPFAPGGGLERNDAIPVQWEVATDEGLRKVVQSGTYYATSRWGHSVHAEPTGLEPGRDYWYRFTAGGQRSEVGRTRTAPAPDASNEHLRVAVASCQQYEHGYFLAYRHMLDDDLDLVVHVGDYIYEESWGLKRIRSHNAPEVMTLDDYRARYALYRGESELKSAHAMYPWLVTWDDHEVENDYSGWMSENDDPKDWFLARRAAAYQAFYEHMPLPSRAIPYGPDMRLHADRTFGQLASICMLDTRQYRSPLACTEPGRRGSRSTNCDELRDPMRTKLGSAQEGWLSARMAASKARWNLFASGTVMAYIDEQRGPGERFWNDGWNGYPAARARFMNELAETKVTNPVVVSGDIHSFLTARHHKVPNDLSSPVIASEFVATSISAQGVSQATLDERRSANPNVLYANTERRGYLRLDVTPQRLQADLVGMESVTDRNAGRKVQASFVVESGRAGPIAQS
jgi:alkaline phosphatase D